MKPGIKSINVDEDIYSKVTDDDLAYWYFGITSIPCLINSPLRKDKNPSFGVIRIIGKSTLWWTDFSTGEHGNMLQLLEKYWNLPLYKVVDRICKDIPKMPGKILDKKKPVYRKNGKTGTKISCCARQWRKHDLDYWNSYGISLRTLKQCDVYPVSTIIIEKDNNVWRIPAEKYAYCYVERKEGVVTLKIYQPFSAKHKWSNGNDNSVWNLWEKLPENGEVLIITSSRKDSMCITENTGYPSVSLQGEGYMPKPTVMDELKSRFTKIYVLYDNDFSGEKNWGRILGKKICDKFNLTQIEIPEIFLSKDPSDLCHNYSREKLKEVIVSLVENKKIVLDNKIF